MFCTTLFNLGSVKARSKLIDCPDYLVYVWPLAERGSVYSARFPMMSGGGIFRAIVFIGLSIAFRTIAHAESKYNPLTGQWENVSSDAVPQMNPITGRWELAAPNSVAKLNPYTRQYEMVPANSITRYNPIARQWELAPPDAKLELDPHTGAWHYER
jgi:hypothetical protein